MVVFNVATVSQNYGSGLVAPLQKAHTAYCVQEKDSGFKTMLKKVSLFFDRMLGIGAWKAALEALMSNGDSKENASGRLNRFIREYSALTNLFDALVSKPKNSKYL